jgi:ABC-type antimicrobial peptide transport system permease subunit
VIGYATKPAKAQALERVQAAAVTSDLTEITTALHASPVAALMPLCRDCPCNGVSGPTVPGLMAWRERCRDDRDTGSSALVAQAAAKAAFNSLFLGLGAVALLVGAIGVANIMVISVLERRSEIGLRRALGATKGHIRTQFLSEAILLALAGGVVGIGLGALATAIYAHVKGWATVIPTDAWAGGLAATILIGALAGLLPALRAARLNPTEALWSL